MHMYTDYLAFDFNNSLQFQLPPEHMASLRCYPGRSSSYDVC